MSEPKPPTKAQYDAAEPFAKGVMAYNYSAWPHSEIPNEKNCPYPAGSKERDRFNDGVHAAMLNAQDSEE